MGCLVADESDDDTDDTIALDEQASDTPTNFVEPPAEPSGNGGGGVIDPIVRIPFKAEPSKQENRYQVEEN